MAWVFSSRSDLTSLGSRAYDAIAREITTHAVMKYPNALSCIAEPPEKMSLYEHDFPFDWFL